MAGEDGVDSKDNIGLHYKCKNCGKTCSLTYDKMQWYKKMNFTMPKYCNPICREQYHK